MRKRKHNYRKDIMATTGEAVTMSVGAGVVGAVGSMVPAGAPTTIGTNVAGAMRIASIGVPLQASKGLLKQLDDLK